MIFARGARADNIGRYGVRVVSPVTTEQITLTQARLHLRLTASGSPASHPDDQWLLDTIPTAREWCEHYTGRSIAPQTLEMTLTRFANLSAYDGWPWPFCFPLTGSEWDSVIYLPGGPVAGVESVIYLDGDGVAQVMDPSLFELDPYTFPSGIIPVAGTSWPTAKVTPNAIRIRYQAGYDLPGDSPNERQLPSSIRSAMLLLLAHLYENREQTTDLKLVELPLGVQSLLAKYQLDFGWA